MNVIIHPDYSLLSLVDEQLSLAISRRDRIARKADSRKRMELTMIWRACKTFATISRADGDGDGDGDGDPHSWVQGSNDHD